VKKYYTLKFHLAGCQWLTLVVPPPWEAEIWRIKFQGQPRKIIHVTPFSKKKKKGKLD
jgi:hypothetical protein